MTAAHHGSPTDSSLVTDKKSAQLLRRVTYASVLVAVFLVMMKFGAWVYTDSVAILSGLVDSTLDAIASAINFVAVRQALQPADREHRFGHGKAEALSGLAQSTFILGSVLFLIFESTPRLFRLQEVDNSSVGITISVVAMALTLVLVGYQRYVILRTKSVAISADSLHYVTDLLLNMGVILALILTSTFGWLVADPICAILVALVILYGAIQIFRRSYDQLMDREFPSEDREKIKRVALAHPDVIDLHDLRTRTSGYSSFIQMHLELPASLSLVRAHQIADEVELSVRKYFPEAEVMIHQDPEGVTEERREFH